MAAETGYDTTNLLALSLELQRLNAAAVKSGLLRSNKVLKGAPLSDAPGGSVRRKSKSEAKAKSGVAKAKSGASKPKSKTANPAASSRRGKLRARRLLALLRRAEDDTSPDVVGTDFTEDGVVRLMARLSKPRSRQSLFLRKMERFLLRPCAYGVRTTAGIGVERLQLVSRQLIEIEAQGWDSFQARRAARRTREASDRAAMPIAVKETD